MNALALAGLIFLTIEALRIVRRKRAERLW
ncbi:MAG: hypothetical protein DI637_01505 [Citromicrobium sp.]|nr:MAG: hypothetical protein DI637_01505 [Citromicrobium sp.]